LIKDFLSV